MEKYLVVSILRKPTLDKRLMNSILTAVSTHFGSFCKPSRGPTSTIRISFFPLVPCLRMLCLKEKALLSIHSNSYQKNQMPLNKSI